MEDNFGRLSNGLTSLRPAQPAFHSQPESEEAAAAGALIILEVAPNPKPKYCSAFLKHTFCTILPSSASSSGSSPFSASRPSRLQKTRRKYSCRGNDINDRESVNMPTNRDSSPVFERALRCHSMPSF